MPNIAMEKWLNNTMEECAMTVRQIIRESLKNIKKNASEETIEQFTEYILDHSRLKLTKDRIELSRVNAEGVDEGDRKQAIENLPISFYFVIEDDINMEDIIRNQGEEHEIYWFLESLPVALLEYYLVSYTVGPQMSKTFQVFIHGKRVSYNKVNGCVNWIGMTPYRVSYQNKHEIITEEFSDLDATTKRVIQLTKDNIRNIEVINSIDNRIMHYEIIHIVYNSLEEVGYEYKLCWLVTDDELDDEEFYMEYTGLQEEYYNNFWE